MNNKSPQELEDKVTTALNAILHHHDDTCSGVKKEEVATVVKLFHSHMQTAFDDKYSIDETVFNNSGWGVGSNGTPLRIKPILLEVDWEGSKSSRYLKSSDVSHKWLGGDK